MTLQKANEETATKPTIRPNNLIFGALQGLAIGTTLELIFSFATSNQYYPGTPAFLDGFENQNTAALITRLIYVFLGVCLQMLASLYDRDSFSLLSATLLNYLGGIILLVSAGLFLKWVEFGWSLVGFILVATIIYLFNWTVIWLSIRAQIKKTNQKLAERQLA